MGNPVVHWELMSKEPATVADLYARIFGWKVNHVPEINSRIVEPDREGPWPGEHALMIVSAGGKIHVEEQKVPRMGKFWKAKR